MIRIGLVSDTHGLLRPEALDVLRGSDFIVHAGDIGEGVLEPLSTIAPVTAVRGNNDRAPWAQRIAETEQLRFGDVMLHVLHDLAGLAIDPKAAGVDVVVSGHSHRPKVERRSGVLYVNPGSAGPVRFRLPVSVALMQVTGKDVAVRIVELESLRTA
ncbi:metallophosphoesterase family protein [Scleromatobacter humisilvae]|uniref:Phosphoesterase n=1 Tax=Scleromatobacter humisilvae TaxID=2897159 RepID=A0A9X2BXM6_9BURK|nr:metallophosphoesterase family protein [Scleromatobacter humisilvae]MCK9684738.1 metallophosphatase family protein [Scleromatobacter humisilvae]